MKRWLLILVAILVAPVAMAQDAYRIKPGDTLSITVLEDPNLNREVLVRPDGGISMPIAGNVQAGGNSIVSVERIIAERISSGFSVAPTVSVALTQLGRSTGGKSSTIKIYVLGEVAGPGLKKVTRGTSILEALAEIGGLGKFAAEKRIQIRRTDASGREVVYLFDYSAVERGALLKNNIKLRSGDVIVVPERRLFEF